MTDEPTRMPIGDAIEVLVRTGQHEHQMLIHGAYDRPGVSDNDRKARELYAALAAFDGWGEAIDEQWLDQRFKRYAFEPVWFVGENDCGVLDLHGKPTGYYLWYDDSGHLVSGRPKTRGDLLGLLHFLGVEL